MIDFFYSITPSAYGFLFAVAGIAAYGTTRFLFAKSVVIPKQLRFFDFVFILLVISGVLGGRALYVFYNLPYFIKYPSEIPAIWHGGWVWHGALVGGALALFIYAKVKRFSFLLLADIISPGLALAQGIGRWGNYFNQELYGLPTNLPWAISIDAANRVSGFESYTRFHPTFFYESAWDFALFALLFILANTMYRQQNNRTQWTEMTTIRRGDIFALYLILYSFGRFIIEFIRIDPVPLFAGLRAPQWWSIGFIFIGAFILLSGVLARLARKKESGIIK